MASTLTFHTNVSISSHFRHSPSSPPSPSQFPLKTPQTPLSHSKSHNHQTLVSLLPRRLFLPSVSGIFNALTGVNSARDSILAIRRGMQLFKQGDVVGSVVEFDRAIELDPRQKAYLWQRGLSLYYLDRFEDGAEQFRIDVAQNPNDTEESIWCYLCEAQLYGVDEARSRFLEVGRDSRPYMREAYNLFKDGGDPEKLVSLFLHGQEHEIFYASLYAALYYESEKKAEAAKSHMLAACQSLYGLRSDDYMAALAKVHCLCRNWAAI